MSETNQFWCMNVLLVQPASLVFRGVRGQGRGAEQGSGKVLNPRVPISTLFGLQSQAELWGARKGLKLLLSSCLVQYLWTSEARGPDPCIYLALLIQGSRGRSLGKNSASCKLPITCNLSVHVCDQECCLCMCVSAACLHVCTYTPVCSCMWRSEDDLGCHFS